MKGNCKQKAAKLIASKIGTRVMGDPGSYQNNMVSNRCLPVMLLDPDCLGQPPFS